MTARRSAYAQALRSAGNMAPGQAGDDDGPTVSAGPRPRSRFEEGWEETAFDLLPPQAQDTPTAPPAPADHRPWTDRPRPAPTAPPAVGEGPVAAPRPRPERTSHQAPAPPRASAPADGGAEAARAVLPGTLVPAAGPVPTTEAGEPAGSGATPAAPAPGAVLLPAPHLPASARPPAPTPAEVAQAQPTGTATAPPNGASATGAATAFDAVRADPLPLEPRPAVPAADAPPEPARVVVEIGRVEVRVVAGPPPTPARRPGPRTRTGPTLEEYLASGAGSGTGRGTP